MRWLILPLICVAAMLPPSPPKAKKLHRPIVETTQGAGAAKLIARVNIVIPPSKSLVWDYSPNADNPWSNVVFVVRSSSTLGVPRTNWPVVAITPTNQWDFEINPNVSAAFFVVSTSNTITHLVSE